MSFLIPFAGTMAAAAPAGPNWLGLGQQLFPWAIGLVAIFMIASPLFPEDMMKNRGTIIQVLGGAILLFLGAPLAAAIFGG